eukprot:7584668-Ditylum_brightwellii.AAC.1
MSQTLVNTWTDHVSTMYPSGYVSTGYRGFHEVLGGYNNLCMVWRLELPDWMFVIFTVIFLEFLANIITNWTTVPFMPLISCYLNLSDSTSTVDRLYKYLFQPDTQYKHTTLTRHYTEVNMDCQLIGYSQHVQGIHNNITNCLPCHFHLSEDQLTFLFLYIFHNKMMKSF